MSSRCSAVQNLADDPPYGDPPATHGCHPLRGVATYGDVYKLTYLRGPSGIIVMLAEELKKS